MAYSTVRRYPSNTRVTKTLDNRFDAFDNSFNALHNGLMRQQFSDGVIPSLRALEPPLCQCEKSLRTFSLLDDDPPDIKEKIMPSDIEDPEAEKRIKDLAERKAKRDAAARHSLAYRKAVRAAGSHLDDRWTLRLRAFC